ncbi:MAG: hypothetical protein M3R00_05200 [Pseudomonadota bacterium]|nr:hypothetical protein [Pseudomonadota bacterium]
MQLTEQLESASIAIDNFNYKIFIDVDDTLLSVADEETLYNDLLIKLLKQIFFDRDHPLEIVFLTKMNADRLTYNSPLRLPLITYLQEQGIIVSKVLTPLDSVFAQYNLAQPHTDGQYVYGSAYAELMRPVEQSLVDIRHAMNKQCFNTLLELLELQAKIERLQSLMRQRHVLEESREFYPHSLQAYLDTKAEEADSDELSKIDYSQFHIDFSEINQYIKKDATHTFGTYLQLLSGLINSKNVTALTSEKQLVTSFIQERTRYRNRKYLADLYHNTLLPHKRVEHTKGEVYINCLPQLKLQQDHTLVFIDDSINEHQSLKQKHAEHALPYKLLCLLPPHDVNFYRHHHTNKPCISEELFIFALIETFESAIISRCLTKHYPAGDESAIKTNLSHHLNSTALMLIQSGNYLGARCYVKLAFYLAQSDAQRLEVIHNAVKIESQKQDSKHEPSFNNIAIEAQIALAKQTQTSSKLYEFSMLHLESSVLYELQSTAPKGGWFSWFSTDTQTPIFHNKLRNLKLKALHIPAGIELLKERFKNDSQSIAIIHEENDSENSKNL